MFISVLDFRTLNTVHTLCELRKEKLCSHCVSCTNRRATHTARAQFLLPSATNMRKVIALAARASHSTRTMFIRMFLWIEHCVVVQRVKAALLCELPTKRRGALCELQPKSVLMGWPWASPSGLSYLLRVTKRQGDCH